MLDKEPPATRPTDCAPNPNTGSGPLKIVLISPYELGRQPFALAEPAAWLRAQGYEVQTLDLSQQRLDPDALSHADVVAVYLGMHTATRIAMEALPRIRELAPEASLCAYGLYAPVNAARLRDLGVETVLGGESEPQLIELADAIANTGTAPEQAHVHINLDKIDFKIPDRSSLPPLTQYANLRMPGDGERTVGFVEGSRGCKHLCRHCPVVPVYQGKFRIVPVDIVMADVEQQVQAGAQHVSFGDPDFLNGPTHALRLVRALHQRFPDLTYDVTIKVEHLVNHADVLNELKRTGCLFITCAVESVDSNVLEYLDKGHTLADFRRAVQLLRDAGIAMAPTFVPFTPWTRLDSYVALLRELVDQRLVESVPPIQLSIRLLIPQGSRLLELPELAEQLEPFDPAMLGYPWHNPDPRVDQLQREVQQWVADAEEQGHPRRRIFEEIWKMAHGAMGTTAPTLPEGELGTPIPHMSEPWYCCAEPTDQQLQSF